MIQARLHSFGSDVVYMLEDPDKPSTAYIGVTSSDVRCRMFQHLAAAFGKPDYSNRRKQLWLRDINLRGKLPNIYILERVPIHLRISRELYWIKFHKSRGFDLVNAGEGYRWSPNPKQSPMKGKKTSIKQKLAVSAACKGKPSHRKGVPWSESERELQTIRKWTTFTKLELAQMVGEQL